VADVRLTDLSCTYPDGTAAVRGVSLAVADGELMVIVGPSGCGKSTLLRMVAGLEPASAGTVAIGGRDVTDLSPQARNVAMVFQSYALYPHLTVAGNLAFPLRMRGLPRAEIARRVAEAAHLLSLTPLLERRPAALSGGERQRVAMGRALVRDPDVFLLDEPLSNLDAALRVEIRAEIAALQRRTGTTCLYVTHDQVEAMTLGSRVAVMEHGRLHQVDAPRALYEAPADTFVARFIGSPGMNLVPARLEPGPEGPCLRLGAAAVPLPAPVRARQPKAEGAAGEVSAGLRPEALALEGPGPRLTGTVRAVERLGHEVLAHVALAEPGGCPPVAARLPADAELEEGDGVALVVDVAAVRLFGRDGTAL
jgi:multiple sugar transport system ATP-binding protein